MSEVSAADWRVFSFQDAFEVVSDQGRRIPQRDYCDSGDVPVVDQGEGLIGGYTDQREMTYDGKLPVIVFGDHTRRIKLVSFRFAVGAQGTKLLLPRPFIEPRFAYWLLQSVRLEDRGYGRHFALLRKQTFRVPPRREQLRIVDILEDHLSRLDAANDYISAASGRAETLVTSALLNEESIASSAKLTLRELLAEPLSNGRSVPTREGGFPVLRLTALQADRVNLNEYKGGAWTIDEARPFLVQRGDFLVARGNGSLRLVARGALVHEKPNPVAYPDTLIRVRINRERVMPAFFSFVWNSPIVRRQVESMARTTAGIYKVNQKHLENVVLPVPSLDEQAQACARMEHVRVAQRHLAVGLATSAKRSGVLRRALLAAAFSGRLTGRASDMEIVEEMAGV